MNGCCEAMKQFESEHYIFHYGANTKAEQDISEIAAYRQFAFLQKSVILIPECKS